MWQYLTSLFKSDAQLEYDAWLYLAGHFMTRGETHDGLGGICYQIEHVISFKESVRDKMVSRLETYMNSHGMPLQHYIWPTDRLGCIRRSRLCLKFAYLTLKEIQESSHD